MADQSVVISSILLLHYRSNARTGHPSFGVVLNKLANITIFLQAVLMQV